MSFSRQLWFGIGILVLILAVYAAAFYFLSSDVETQAQELVATRNLSTQRSKLLALLAELKKSSTQVDFYQAKLGALLPTEKQLIGISRSLDALSRSNQVSMDFNFEGSTVRPTADNLGYNGFRVSLQGPYDSILNFLQAIELRSSQYLMTLSDYELSQSGDNYQFSAHGKLYFRQ